MNFIPKISGTMVTDFNIKPIIPGSIINLETMVHLGLKQKSMDFLLDNFRFSRIEYDDGIKYEAILDHDTILKITVLEKYPEYEKEFIEYFGENWLNQYIRFNH